MPGVERGEKNAVLQRKILGGGKETMYDFDRGKTKVSADNTRAIHVKAGRGTQARLEDSVADGAR